MMLQKTSSRIKQFISHRRVNSMEESGDLVEEERFTERRISTNTPRTSSWLSQTPSTEFTTIRRTNTATARGPPLALPVSSACSSVSSLCSCDCESNPASNEYSLSRPQPRLPSSETLYLPPLSSAETCGDAETWRLIFSEASSLSPESTSSDTGTKTPSFTKARLSTFDLLEALSIDPVDEAKTSAQSSRRSRKSEMENVSDDVDQLIRETDEAFQAVGNALENVKAATQGWYDAPEAAQTTSSVAKPLAILRRNSRSQMSLTKSPPGRSVSVIKPKRKKPMKRRRNLLARALKTSPPPPANTPTRWTLTDVTANVADVFSGKIFRTEVDEMLTPGRLQQIKQENRKGDERKASHESFRSADSGGSTPTEPFHLESLSSRIDAALGNPPPLPSPFIPPPSAPIYDTEHVHGSENPPSADISIAPGTNDSMVIDDLIFPSPPRPTRSRASSRATQFLPTIPEVSPLTMIPNQNLHPIPKLPPAHLQPVQTYILLESTPFTLTSPTFRHGPIRLERILKYPQELSPEPEEEPLDWTAFQMAISGTMDDMTSPNDANNEWEANEAEIGDLMKWWESFGFEGFGRLAQDAPIRTRVKNDKRQSSWRGGAAGSVISEPQEDGAQNEGIESACIRNGGHNNVIDGLQLNTSAAELIEGEDGKAESLPSSPMVDIDPGGSRRDNDVPIPMGFNLGHDLGDFLNWETQHVQSMLPDR